MFTITVQYHMQDTQRFIADSPSAVINTLMMSDVLHIDIASNRGD